ncbi:MAG: Na+/H+ antiporter [Solirubrobacteraceae bacterium]|nr:Na+/H+ antiporter [Solirubrobacteraceae bacterium]
MGDIEFLFALLLGAALLVRVADLVRIPYPIVLVLGGLSAGLIPGVPDLEVDPDIIFLVFLPPLVHAAAWYASPQQLLAERKPLGLLTVGLVLVTMAVVAVVAHALVPGMGWTAAFILGALLAPTDPVAALATFGKAGAPARATLLVEGEAMLNDAVALVAYRVAVAAAVSGVFSIADAGWDVVVAVVGGVLVGLAVGWATRHVQRRLPDLTLTIFLSILASYAAYIVAEELGASGILATVVAGLYLSWHSHETFDADTRLSAAAVWDVLVFGLNAAIFVLLGLQFPELVEDLELGSLLVPALAVSAAVIVTRLVFLLLPWSGFGESLPERLAIGWAGMRGAISLAAALAVPLAVDERGEILFITVVVILVTLVGQGLSLRGVLHVLGVEEDRDWSPDEALARRAATEAALERLGELEDEHDLPDRLVQRVRELYQARMRRTQAALEGDEHAQESPGAPKHLAALRRELIGVERDTLLRLRDEGSLTSDVLRQIERDLDLEEARFSGP